LNLLKEQSAVSDQRSAFGCYDNERVVLFVEEAVSGQQSANSLGAIMMRGLYCLGC
jgi:hypothetical protein